MNGLPSDSFSKENSIITKSSSRQPLFIDPQMQALKWIKANQKSEGDKVVCI
jgi:dynein heavy chain, axonemal